VKIKRCLLVLFLFCCFDSLLIASTIEKNDSKRLKPLKNAIATAHPLATQAGKLILEQGGNAFDAAIAISATLAVVEPYSSGVGGGGFWLLHQAGNNKTIFLDGREKAPLKAHEALYLDAQGNYRNNSSIDGALAAGIPGSIAALAHLSKKYGRLRFSQCLAPAIKLAKQGFKVTKLYQRMAKFRHKAMLESIDASKILLDQGKVPQLGHLIVQTDLANTLSIVAEQGAKGFYQGHVAQAMVDAVNQAGGIWSLEDLKQYQVVEREPVGFSYKNIKIYTAPPPSSGGIALNTILNILSAYPLDNIPSSLRQHYIVEAMRRAYRDRAQYLGDSDFVDVPKNILISKEYAAGLRASIHPDHRLASDKLPGYKESSGLGTDTTHFVVLDKEGNSVSATMSVNYPFGSGFIANGTGVLLNDEMDDFSVKPGTANAYGLVGAKANAIEAGKRPLSSMSPSYIEVLDKENKVSGVALLGTPGGSRIITMVLLAILELDQSKEPQLWVDTPRFHHQYLPDQIFYEQDTITMEQQKLLTEKGHTFKATQNYGNMQALWWDFISGKVSSASDKRGEGQAISF